MPKAQQHEALHSPQSDTRLFQRSPCVDERALLGAKERAGILGSKLIAVLISFAWLIYAGTTGYVVWRILAGDVPSFLRNYTLGTNAAWIIVGIVLWVLTEWFREFKDSA